MQQEQGGKIYIQVYICYSSVLLHEHVLTVERRKGNFVIVIIMMEQIGFCEEEENVARHISPAVMLRLGNLCEAIKLSDLIIHSLAESLV